MFSRTAEARIEKAVRWAERQMQSGPDRAGRTAPAAFPFLFARVTSSTADADGHYPAVITQPTDPNGWSDAAFPCKLRFANGGVPVEGNRYPCRPAHGNSAGEDVYITGTGGGDAVPGVSGCDLAGLMATDCLYAAGPLGWTYLRYVSDSSGTRWVSDSDLYWTDGADEAHGEVIFTFADGLLHLSLAGGELLYCGDGCWRGGELTGHIANNGDLDLDACEGQVFSVCLSCSCCPIAGWLGEGWYCADIGDGCEPLHLLEKDKCDPDITICSGPYPNETAAILGCSCAAGSMGPNSADSAANFAIAGVAWGTPANALIADTTYTTATTATPGPTDALDITDFDFTDVPDTATILGVKVEVLCMESGGQIKTHTLQLLSAGSLIGTNQSAADEWPASPAYLSWGGSSDLMGATLTPAIVKSATFGVRIRASVEEADAVASVDHVRLTVWWDCSGLGITYPCGATPGNEPIVTSGTFSAQTGEATCLNTITVIQTGPATTPTQFDNHHSCEGNKNWELACGGGIYTLTEGSGTMTITMISGSPTSQVWFISFNPGSLVTAGSGGTAVLTLAGTFP